MSEPSRILGDSYLQVLESAGLNDHGFQSIAFPSATKAPFSGSPFSLRGCLFHKNSFKSRPPFQLLFPPFSPSFAISLLDFIPVLAVIFSLLVCVIIPISTRSITGRSRCPCWFCTTTPCRVIPFLFFHLSRNFIQV